MVLPKALVQPGNELPELSGKSVASDTSNILVYYNDRAGVKILATKSSSSLVAHDPDTIALKITTQMSMAKSPKDHRFRPHGGSGELCRKRAVRWPS